MIPDPTPEQIQSLVDACPQAEHFADYERPFPCWCGFFCADYVCEEHMAQTKAELLMKIQELESIIWDGTRQLAALEAALKQASERCARPAGVCFPAQNLGDSCVGQASGLGDGAEC